MASDITNIKKLAAWEKNLNTLPPEALMVDALLARATVGDGVPEELGEWFALLSKGEPVMLSSTDSSAVTSTKAGYASAVAKVREGAGGILRFITKSAEAHPKITYSALGALAGATYGGISGAFGPNDERFLDACLEINTERVQEAQEAYDDADEDEKANKAAALDAAKDALQNCSAAAMEVKNKLDLSDIGETMAWVAAGALLVGAGVAFMGRKKR